MHKATLKVKYVQGLDAKLCGNRFKNGVIVAPGVDSWLILCGSDEIYDALLSRPEITECPNPPIINLNGRQWHLAQATSSLNLLRLLEEAGYKVTETNQPPNRGVGKVEGLILRYVSPGEMDRVSMLAPNVVYMEQIGRADDVMMRCGDPEIAEQIAQRVPDAIQDFAKDTVTVPGKRDDMVAVLQKAGFVVKEVTSNSPKRGYKQIVQ